MEVVRILGLALLVLAAPTGAWALTGVSHDGVAASDRFEQRKDPSLASIPVIVISAVGSLDMKVAPLEAAAFLRKPVQLDELLGVVERYCR